MSLRSKHLLRIGFNKIEMLERANCTIMKMTRYMFYAQNLHKLFWVKVVANVIYTQNQCPMRVLHSITPGEMWNRRSSCIVHMCVFGCVAYAMVPIENKGNMDVKATKYLFWVILKELKPIGCYVCNLKKIIKIRDVVLMENNTIVGNNLEMHPIGRNEGYTLVIMNESSKLSSCDNVEECEEQVEIT